MDIDIKYKKLTHDRNYILHKFIFNYMINENCSSNLNIIIDTNEVPLESMIDIMIKYIEDKDSNKLNLSYSNGHNCYFGVKNDIFISSNV